MTIPSDRWSSKFLRGDLKPSCAHFIGDAKLLGESILPTAGKQIAYSTVYYTSETGQKMASLSHHWNRATRKPRDSNKRSKRVSSPELAIIQLNNAGIRIEVIYVRLHV